MMTNTNTNNVPLTPTDPHAFVAKVWELIETLPKESVDGAPIPWSVCFESLGAVAAIVRGCGDKFVADRLRSALQYLKERAKGKIASTDCATVR